MTTQEILALPMEDNDAGAETIGQYLERLLVTLWMEEEGFNGKKPFGNSGWPAHIYKTLVEAKVVEGSFDKYGQLDEFDWEAADKLIVKCIHEVFNPQNNEVK